MNKIPQGYKQTEVGVIPEDWEVSSLESITDPKRTISYGIVQTGPNIQNGIRCLRVVDIEDGKIKSEDMITTTKAISDSYKRTILKAEDLVMPLRGKVGDIAIVNDDLAGCNLTRGVALVAVRSDWSARYCRQYISSSSTRNRLEQSMNGSALQEIPIAALRYFKIALPPTKAEQEAIANGLSDTDALIESLEQLITKKRQLKQGTMHELLTGKKRLPGFSETWEASTLSAVSREPMQNGIFYNPILKGVGVRLINVGDLYNPAPIDTDSLELFGATEKECERFQVEDGDLFFTRSSIVPSGIAHCNIYRALRQEPVVFDSHVIRMRPDTTKVDPSYLFRFCISSVARHYLISHAKTATMTTIDQGVLGKCPVFLPSKAEQTAIATILSDMDTEISTLETKLAKTRKLKQGMMHNLLTGRIRLVESGKLKVESEA